MKPVLHSEIFIFLHKFRVLETFGFLRDFRVEKV